MLFWIADRPLQAAVRAAAQSYARRMGETADTCLVSRKVADLPTLPGFAVRRSDVLPYLSMIAVYKDSG